MTTTQRILLTVALATTTAAVYEGLRAFQMQQEIRTLREQQATLATDLQQVQRDRDDGLKRLAQLTDENAAFNDKSSELSGLREELSGLKAAAQTDAKPSAAKSWLDRVDQLKQRMEQTPNAKIPELQFVTERDWLDAAKRELKTEVDYRCALSALRAAGEGKFASMLKKAVTGYMQDNNEQFPTDLTQLQPYFEARVDDAVLQRWEIVPASKVKTFAFYGDRANVLITQKAAVDDVFDRLFAVGSQGVGSTDFLSGETSETMKQVWGAYRAAHNDQLPKDTSELEPYVTTPEQRAAFDKMMLRDSTSKDSLPH